MRIRNSIPNSPISLSLSSSSSITTNSLASSTDSSSSAPIPCPSIPSRCRGLDLLVKAIHQVTAGSAVGFPYIQKRVIRRRRRAVCFDKLCIMIADPKSSLIGRDGRRRRRSIASLPSKYQDSVLQSWRPKSRRSVKVLD